MKRLIALTVLAVGLLPSLPIDFASAIVPNQTELQRHCRDRLGFGQTEPVYGSLLLQLRRCIDNTRTQYEHASRLLNRAGITHYSSVTRDVSYGRETQRSLNTRMLDQEKTRKSYYHNVPLGDREFILQEHRRSKRLIVQEQERRLLRQRREKLQRWRQALQTCKYYASENRHDCVQFELTAP
ncbi:MAG: hypothetical protein HOG89_05560 [Candidatus Peribacter sp.]|mgnify:FL=1|jgi:hypothetical protein|nr:hypothetical protein [Candidatus Peribacter sp.]MBT4392446.1 hypothetical protein [Candidatus Peribacter sp.]MBT4601224.1 hypothetical protein [Candidatus Peribacter sp.]MBT5149273.1 hypothetical protein [Candidatus Peribacter sp.]MBT5637097.1 hypothetical protein [Candidatus Peribacter sp.]